MTTSSPKEIQLKTKRAIIGGIERGLADVNAGRTVSHETAMVSVRHAIEVAAVQRDRIDPKGFLD